METSYVVRGAIGGGADVEYGAGASLSLTSIDVDGWPRRDVSGMLDVLGWVVIVGLVGSGEAKLGPEFALVAGTNIGACLGALIRELRGAFDMNAGAFGAVRGGAECGPGKEVGTNVGSVKREASGTAGIHVVGVAKGKVVMVEFDALGPEGVEKLSIIFDIEPPL